MTLQELAEWDSGSWQTAARAARASIETRLFIDGRYVDAAKGGRFATVDPATGETIAEMSAGTAEDIDLAVAAAKRAFRSGVWSRMAPRQRMEILFRFASLIERDSAQLAVLETLDMGKPIADVVGVDLPSVIDTIRFMADRADLDRAVTAAYRGIFSNMGEVCNAGSRLLVDRTIYERFVQRFVELGRDAYRPGKPLDPATNMGPLVTREAQRRVLGLIEAGQREGARLEFGGCAPDGMERGAYVSPTLFTDVRNDMSIARQEIFGPVAAIIPFDGIDEAVAIANDTIYGLAAGVWTRNVDTA